VVRRIAYFNANFRAGENRVKRFIYKMIKRQSIQEPFAFWLVRAFLPSEEDVSEDLRPISDKEFYAVLAMLIAGVAALALTIGPFAIL
jgi:hypothetical protein